MLGRSRFGSQLVDSLLPRQLSDLSIRSDGRRPRGWFPRKARIDEMITKAAPSIRTPKARNSLFGLCRGATLDCVVALISQRPSVCRTLIQLTTIRY